MTKYEIIFNDIEVKKNDDIYEGCTLDQANQEPVTLKIFDSKAEALEALEGYQSGVSAGSGLYLVTEYYVQENIYNEDGEWVDGGDVVAFAPMKEVDD